MSVLEWIWSLLYSWRMFGRFKDFNTNLTGFDGATGFFTRFRVQKERPRKINSKNIVLKID